MSKKLSDSIRNNPRPKTFEIARDKLADFVCLQPKQYDLLISMINGLKPTHELSSFIGRGYYKTFGYDTRQTYYRDKKALEDLGFIITEGREYYVRLDAIMYTSKRNYDNLLKKTGTIRDPFSGFSSNNYIPPVPKS